MYLPKYRAWHKEYKMMFQVAGIYWFCNTYCITCNSIDGDFEFNAEEIELMQWTGLQTPETMHNKPVDIYEGDIVIYADDKFNDSKIIGRVIWNNDWSAWHIESKGWPCGGESLFNAFRYGYEEVIGNIYEHKHLLVDE